MPDQIKRLLIVVVIVGAIFIVVRAYFIPESFGKYGHYRAVAVDSVKAQNVQYAGHQVCIDCHDDIYDVKKNSYHRNVNCEACHGPSAEHVASFEEDDTVLPTVPRARDHCTLCHGYDPAKPTGFAQIDPVAHNPMKPCISCHNAHAPDPLEVPGECGACHAKISRTKALSPHALLNCIECHTTPEEHKSNPRAWLPDKPVNRSDCGKCHSSAVENGRFIPRIDSSTHKEGYLCWQCHYPHSPRAR